MLSHYIKLAIRNSWRYRGFTAINVLGLSIGIACFLLVGGYVWQEWQVNKDLRNLDQQYIIQSKWKQPGMGLEMTTIGQLPVALQEQYPHLVANYYRFDGITSNVSKGNLLFREGLQVGDSTLLTMYGFPLKYGDPSTALDEPFSVVITTQMAQKYFDREDVVGETLVIENFSNERRNFEITGVLEKAQNSITTYNDSNDTHFFIPKNTLSFFDREIDSWMNPIVIGFLELQEGVQPNDLNAAFQQLLADNTLPHVAENLEPYLVSLQDYYLNANNGTIRKMIFILAATALFILLMAVINFVNIAVSQSDMRMKEIGVRKILGSLRRELIGQFYVESTLLVSLATLIGIGIYHFTSPTVSTFLNNSIPSLGSYEWYFIPILGGFIMLTGILAGTYPALIIAAFKSTNALKGQLVKANDNTFFRKGLLAFQFFIAAVVLTGSIIVAQQVRHFFNKDLGYNKDYIITAPLSRDWSEEGVNQMERIRQQLVALPEVEQISLSYSVPSGNVAGQNSFYKVGTDSTSAISTASIIVDHNYMDTYSLSLAAGDFYDATPIDEPHHIVLNEAAAKALGWQNPMEAVNQRLRRFNNSAEYTIQGILNNYHHASLHQAVRPAVFMNIRENPIYRYFSIKLPAGNIRQSLAAVQRKWSELMPNTPFDYQFQDEALASLYTRELRLQKASYAATLLSIIIALLGIFGLVALSIQKRTREIGIRKVIGAHPLNIIQLFLHDFLPVVLIAGLIACPISWYVMQNWLAEYAYSIDLGAAPFLIALSFLGSLTVLLIGLQCFRASQMNPVDAIRQE